MAHIIYALEFPLLSDPMDWKELLELRLNEDEKKIFNKGVLDIKQAVEMLTDALKLQIRNL